MKSKERIKLSRDLWFNYYSSSIFLPVPGIMCAYFYFTGNQDNFLLFFALVFIVSGVHFYWLYWNRLFFQEFKAEMTSEQFERAVKVTSRQLDWHISKLTGHFAKAYRSPIKMGNGGEIITIKLKGNRLLINSMKDPNLIRRGYSIKRNRQNVDAFLFNAASILKGENVEEQVQQKQEKAEDEFWQESEWTLGKIFMRIVGYGLTALFLLIGIMILAEGDLSGLFFPLVSLGIAFTYIKNDIQILREKRRRKR